jgi:hypothetical protein
VELPLARVDQSACWMRRVPASEHRLRTTADGQRSRRCDVIGREEERGRTVTARDERPAEIGSRGIAASMDDPISGARTTLAEAMRTQPN